MTFLSSALEIFEDGLYNMTPGEVAIKGITGERERRKKDQEKEEAGSRKKQKEEEEEEAR